MGCEHALSNCTEIIESALLEKGYCLAISLDARGAFNELAFDAIFRNMKRIGLDDGIIAINSDFLVNRQVTFTEKGVSLTRFCASGVPQGGVWAAQLFSLCVDGLHEAIDLIDTKVSKYDVIRLCR